MKKKNIILIIAILLVVIVLLVLGFMVLKKNADKKEEKEEVKLAFEVPYDYDFKQVIKYNFGGPEYYIYLLNDNTVKVAERSEIYDTQPDCNCLEPTGKFDTKELDFQYTEIEFTKISAFFEKVFKDVNDDRVDLSEKELDDESTRMILAIILDEDGVITFEDDLKFATNQVELFTKYKGRVGVINKLQISKTDNKLITNISKYMNDFYTADVKEINGLVDKYYNRISMSNYEANYKVDMNTEFIHIGKYYASFTYTETGNIGNNWFNKKKGFAFDFTGTPKQIPGGYKDKYLEQILAKFKESSAYKKYKSSLDKNYEANIKKSIFNVGNWYMTDKSIVFIVTSDMLGVNDITFGYELVEVEKMFDSEF